MTQLLTRVNQTIVRGITDSLPASDSRSPATISQSCESKYKYKEHYIHERLNEY